MTLTVGRVSATRTSGRELPWLDVLRVVATPLVVFIHVASPAIHELPAQSRNWRLLTVLNAGTDWAVPVFVMISGALLLGREHSSLTAFYGRRFRRIGLPLLFWTAAYLLFIRFCKPEGSRMSVKDYVQLVAGGQPYGHLYFLFALAGLYALTPFLTRALRASTPLAAWSLAGAFVLGSWLNTVLQYAGLAAVGFNALTWWVPYLGYYLLGHCVVSSRLRPRQALPLLGAALAAVLLSAASVVLLDGYVSRAAALFAYEKSSLITVAMSASVFAAAVALRGRPVPAAPAAALARISDLTLGVYLVHPMVIELLARRGWPTSSAQDVVRTVAACTLVSFVLVAVARSARPVRWIC